MANQSHSNQFYGGKHTQSQSHSKYILPPMQSKSAGRQKQKHDQSDFHNTRGLFCQQDRLG